MQAFFPGRLITLFKITGLFLLAGCLGWSASTYANNCGSLANQYGPFDYQNMEHRRNRLPVVEKYHFDKDVQALKRGQSTPSPGPDLDYVLRAFPNHIPALYLMVQHQVRLEKKKKPRSASVLSAECYFERALRFRSDDGYVYLVQGYFFHHRGKLKKSLNVYLQAKKLLPENNLDLPYNLGLLYFDLKDYDNAVIQAKKAIRLGHPLPGLKQKLKSVNSWHE